ncbi:MAG: transcription-repair coupling factor [Oscillospiraceae bacterium]|nr:transcription-repair coupling factor [Oscillospiraceae bacterium]
MNLFNIIAEQLPEYRRLAQTVSHFRGNAQPLALTGLSHIHKAHFLGALCVGGGIPRHACGLVLCGSEGEALRLTEDINTLALSEVAMLYPEKDFNFSNTFAMSREYEHRRINVLCAAVNRDNPIKLIISTPAAAAQITLNKEALISKTIVLKKGDSVTTDGLSARLLELGYTRCDMIEGQGQFSIRGSIVDIYPVNTGRPLRMELWGDDIETITAFDIETQRRIETAVKKVELPPCAETLFNCGELLKQLETVELSSKSRAKKQLDEDIIALKTGLFPMNPDKYLPLSDVGGGGLFDYTDFTIVCERAKAKENFNTAVSVYNEELKEGFEQGAIFRGIDCHMLQKHEYEIALDQSLVAFFDTFAKSGNRLNINANVLSPWSGEYKLLTDDLKGYLKKGWSVAVFAGTEKAARTLATDLRDDNLPADYTARPNKLFSKKIYVLSGGLSAGFEYGEALCACLTHTTRNKVTGGSLQVHEGEVIKKQTPKKKGPDILLTDINVGDYVVHSAYGIGVFEGVTKLTKEEISRDYIKLKYAGTDVLYVPVTQLDLLSRYIGNVETSSIRLSSLNSTKWAKAKAKAKSASSELADELIALYSQRLKKTGHSFAPDGEEMHNFENHFSFVETRDQLRCISEIKRDMESQRPMERLLCGDVGFGKTEVALRAAFKCVMDGKQCALLCPTTVLAWQHYQTTLKRMEHFPFNIELLSRFRTPTEIKQVLKKLEKGIVDMVIGTHRLVQDDVKFKDLGLVIIDEEQRFGVNHKEKLKAVCLNADVLTLSATPIPRTLNMAMSGIRDMSVIETPPEDRRPVTTYVVELDYSVIKAAIEKELRRNGQVYYLHNRVESIMSCAARIHELCPEARIGIAHGRMEENEMLDVWQKLLDREIDILVCTTIIETGIDVPNVNTLVIENADSMGLAQLHQLRGRVGRTNRRAFAYFTFTRGKMLTEIAEKRLNAIREFTRFGSGFRIAMKDLEIRGAGSILGQKQSGHLSAVGYDMYLKLLNEAVAEKSGTQAKAKEGDDTCVIDIKADAFIPDSYIGNQAQRISCYKRIADIRTKDDALDVVDELTDRYGELPNSVHGLVRAAQVRNLARELSFSEIVQSGDVINCYIQTPDIQKFMKAINKLGGDRLSLNLTGRVGITLNLDKGEEPLEGVKLFLEAYGGGGF